MPRKRTLLQVRLKAIETINMAGYRKEEELKKLTAEKMIEAGDVSLTELREILRIKDAVRNNRLFSYLSATYEGDEGFDKQKQRSERDT